MSTTSSTYRPRIMGDLVALKVAKALIVKAILAVQESIKFHGTTSTATDAMRRLSDADAVISKRAAGTIGRDLMMSDLDYCAHPPHDFNAAAQPNLHTALEAIRAAMLVLDC